MVLFLKDEAKKRLSHVDFPLALLPPFYGPARVFYEIKNLLHAQAKKDLEYISRLKTTLKWALKRLRHFTSNKKNAYRLQLSHCQFDGE